MEKIVELARQLGKEIAAHARNEGFIRARDKVAEDEAAKQLVNALTEQIRKIAELEHDMKPVEVEDKRELDRLQQEAAQNPALQEFMKAQADYVEMMQRVNDSIRSELEGAEEEKGPEIVV